MAKTTATATGNSLPSTLRAVLSDLLDHDVEVSLDLPDSIDISRVAVEVTADVDRAQDADHDADADADEDLADEDLADEDLAAAATEPESHAEGDEATSEHATGNGVRAAGGVDAGAGDEDEADDDDVPDDQLDREVDVAADFVEGLLDAMDLAGALELRLNDEEQSAEVEIVDMDNGVLIGRRGSTLESVQELLRCVLQSQFDRRVRITVDVEGYRARRLEKLLDKADEAIDEVLDEGEPVRLEPMDVFERKAVHELVAEVEGVASRSQGREPSRRVVIEPS